MTATDKKLLVFHLPKWYPNRYDGLLGIFVKRHILSTLSATQAVVIYIMASRSSETWYDIEESLEEGIVTYRCYYKKRITGMGAFDKLIKLFLYCWLVNKVYKKAKAKFGKPDIINAHVLLRTAVMARFIQWKDSVPYVLLEHSSAFIRREVLAFGNPLSLVVARAVVKKAKAVITVSECLGKGMRERYGLLNQNYQVVYNCVNTSVFTERTAAPVGSMKQLTYVAEFDNTSKNITGLLQAIASLYKKRTDFQVHLIGYGKDEAMLQALASKLTIKDKAVFFKGKYTAPQVAQALQQSNALLMFSHFETLSCIITEALCCGTPVISTAVGGIVEIVNKDNGLLVPEADQSALQVAIEQVLDDQLVVDSHRIALSAQALFSNEAVGQRLISIYKQQAAC